MRPVSRSSGMNRGNGSIGRQRMIRNSSENRRTTETTRETGTYQNATRLLEERSEQISRLESEYRAYRQRGEIMHEQLSRLESEYRGQQSRLVVQEDGVSDISTRVMPDVFPDYEFSRVIDQDSLYQTSLRTNARQVELLIEREGRIISMVNWETIQSTPPLPEYSIQRAQAPHRNNGPYYDGEIRALTIIERLRNIDSIYPSDRIIIRGPTASCGDCQHNVRNYAVRYNLHIDMEYTGPQAIFNARQAAPERNLTNFYGRQQDVHVVRAPLDNGFFHRVNFNNRNMRIPRDQNELSRQLRGRDVNENEGRVVSGVLRNLPTEVREQPLNTIIEPAPPEDVLRRFGINF